MRLAWRGRRRSGSRRPRTLEEEDNLNEEVFDERWTRWHTCGLCEKKYHGVVKCALGWACWKTYLGRPESDWSRGAAMTQLGNGISNAEHNKDALNVREAELSMLLRVGASKDRLLAVQGNLATTYHSLGRLEEAFRLRRGVYSGNLKLYGEEHEETLSAANNYALALAKLQRSEEVKSLLRKTIPVARRVLGEDSTTTLVMRRAYAYTLYESYRDTGTTVQSRLDDLREALVTLSDSSLIAQRVLGGAHPLTVDIENRLGTVRAVHHAILRFLETPPPGGSTWRNHSSLLQPLQKEEHTRRSQLRRSPAPPTAPWSSSTGTRPP